VKILICILYADRNPWRNIVRRAQIPFFARQANSRWSFIYLAGTNYWFVSRIERIVETLRWEKGRFPSYAIAYLQMLLLLPLRAWLPSFRVKNFESQTKISLLSTRIPEMSLCIRWKKIACLKYFDQNTDFTHLIFTTCSSLFNFKVLMDNIRQADKAGPLYAGPIQSSADGDFVSGSFTVLNRESVALLLNNLSAIPLHVMDDIGTGTALRLLGVKPKPLPSLSLSSIEDFSKINFSQIPHFRCKSGLLNERNDVEVMTKLEDFLYGNHKPFH
jgi:hypothetical protein